MQADVCRHLVVSRTAGMKLLSSVTDELDQAMFDVHMNIFKIHSPLQPAALNFSLYGL